MSSTNNDSEDDDPRVHSSGMSSSGQPRRYELSKSELRKNNKPIMEKKRRARINQCLNELKTLILDALKKDPARHTKLEKADILEMTVRHLQSLHRSGSASRPLAPAACPTVESPLSPSSSTAAALTAVVVQKFQTGYQECAGEVNRFVDRLDGVDEDIKKRLMSHLDSCVAKMRYVAAAAGTTPPPPPPPPRPLVNNNSYSLHHRLDLQAAATAAAALAASVPMPTGRPVLQQSLIGRLTPPTVPPPVPPPPSLPKVGRSRASAFTAVHGLLPSPPDVAVGSTPFVYCDEPDVSSTSSWAEDVAAAAAAAQYPPLDFSMKKTVVGCGNKRPLGDISVNVPTANASSSHKQSAAAPSDGDGPTAARVRRPEEVAGAGRPCDGPDSDPNMWRPW